MGVKGRLEFFREFIRFGTVTRPLEIVLFAHPISSFAWEFEDVRCIEVIID